MKKILTFIFIFILSLKHFGQIGIGTEAPNLSTVLDIVSSNKGVLLPRMSTVERDNITTPPEGLLVYNTDNKCLEKYNNPTELWYNICARTISGIGSANINCSGATINGPVLRQGEVVPSSYTVSIPYTKGNGGTYSTTMFPSTGALGVRATILKGNFASGDGVLTFYITGTPSNSGFAVFNINLGGVSCSFKIEVKDTAFATNCATQIGANIPNYPLFTPINIAGVYVNVSKRVSNAPGDIGVNPEGGFCGSSLRDDGSAFRLGNSVSAGISSMTLIFTKPVNNISIISNWYRVGDSHAITTNSTGTISPVNVLSTCQGNFSITTTGGGSRIYVRATAGLNSAGLTYIVKATQPFTEITISNNSATGETNGDDIIAAFAVCDAYVAN